MRKEKPPVVPTPQRIKWTDYAWVDTYAEATAILNGLKQEHKKVCLQCGKFHVKIGAPVKTTPPPTPEA